MTHAPLRPTALLATFLLAVGLLLCDPCQGVADAGTRRRVIAAAEANLGIREATGRNDGARVDEVLASVGLRGSRAPWCAAWNRYIYDQANIRNIGPRSAWSPAWVASPTWKQGRGETPLPGDAWGLAWTLSEGGKDVFRVRHTGLVGEWGKTVMKTYEGNTNKDAVYGSTADRDGGGSHSKRRLIRQVYSVRNWIDPR